MTVKECIKRNGLQSKVDSFKRYQTVDINFINADGVTDETQFNITGIGTNPGTEEVCKLFYEFCKDNGFATTTVVSVTVVAAADTKSELNKIF